jgi:HEAT repeat protein
MAVDGLVDVLSHDYMVRTIPKATIQALGQIGDKRSILPLVDHVKNAPFLRRPKAKVYAEALLKIAEKYPDEVKAALQDDHRRVKRVAKHVRKKI